MKLKKLLFLPLTVAPVVAVSAPLVSAATDNDNQSVQKIQAILMMHRDAQKQDFDNTVKLAKNVIKVLNDKYNTNSEKKFVFGEKDLEEQNGTFTQYYTVLPLLIRNKDYDQAAWLWRDMYRTLNQVRNEYSSILLISELFDKFSEYKDSILAKMDEINERWKQTSMDYYGEETGMPASKAFEEYLKVVAPLAKADLEKLKAEKETQATKITEQETKITDLEQKLEAQKAAIAKAQEQEAKIAELEKQLEAQKAAIAKDKELLKSSESIDDLVEKMNQLLSETKAGEVIESKRDLREYHEKVKNVIQTLKSETTRLSRDKETLEGNVRELADKSRNIETEVTYYRKSSGIYKILFWTLLFIPLLLILILLVVLKKRDKKEEVTA
ncbi:hypothetical protein [Mycoplasmopsis gallopavonis]|uniref:Uncharacterized protein n=1 Tax=Mycoplasmopsis gallopavonis TaxID=76629 RepID=A0A449AZM3_9BACT|nr:hypothetical protein [Mycoplasmopsis gallopavonis]RIV16731.1 hypothetical protein D1113_01255 [Mycoplasmopsis gallopavonis]VEU72963.1 Uncharacterised protein [Mycoplasmopsis gallopavonis]